MLLCVYSFVLAAPYIQGRGSFCHVTVVSIATFVSALPSPKVSLSRQSQGVPGEAGRICIASRCLLAHTYTLSTSLGVNLYQRFAALSSHTGHCAGLAGCTAAQVFGGV